ncbi:MAG TPA: hypothetical protein VFT43_02850 [Candidatus Polarisedimenticolia bacterium]|nr:hypothetical protein [Candidatus Polarisedimenticolia bacterium]
MFGRTPSLIVLSLACFGALAACSGKAGEAGGTGPTAATKTAEARSAPTPATAESQPAAAADDSQPSSDPAMQPQAAAGAVVGIPSPTNTAPIIAVANYFTDLPGLDVAGLKPRTRERFLQRVNSEMCPCGCRNDTLAHCYVNDEHCRVVKGIVTKIYDDVKAGK